MDFQEKIGSTYDLILPLLLEVFESPFLNLGCWGPGALSFPEAQRVLTHLFGEFSQLRGGLDVIDLGCGTGEADFNYLSAYPDLKIIGIDLSRKLIEIATERRSSLPNPSSVEFHCEDILHPHPTLKMGPIDRVMALECAYHFTDKKAFFKKASSLLKKGGSLSLAEPLFTSPEALMKDYSKDILREIPDTFPNSAHYKTQLQKKIQSFVSNEKRLMKDHSTYNLVLKEHPRALKEGGLQLGEELELTERILGFYAPLKKRILELLVLYKANKIKTAVLLTLLAIFYFRYRTFQEGTAGYFFLRAVKIKA